jgi:hypothetical protein
MSLIRCLVLIVMLCAGGSANAEWRRAESAGFVVYSEGSEGQLRERVLQLEEFDRLLRVLTGLREPRSPNKLQLYLVNGPAQLRQIWPAGGADGFYATSPDGIVAVVDHGSRQDWSTHQEVLFHEYAHHFMLQYFPAAYPLWYVEGFAEYVATVRFVEDAIEFGRFNEARASWVSYRSGWLPLEAILFGRTDRLGGEQVAKFYAQSWLLTHYLMRDPERRAQLGRYLTAVTQGQDARQAFAAAFGTNPSVMQRALSRYSSETLTYSRLPRIAAAEAPTVSIEPLAVTDEILLADASSRLTRRGAEAERFLRRIRSLTGERTDPISRRLLARTEALYGDGAAADRLLQPLLAAAPADAELLYLQGMRHLNAGRWEAANRASHFRTARTYFARAHRADENHFPTLYRFAESQSLGADFTSENNMNVLMLANQLAPQVQEIGLALGVLMIRRGDFAGAERVVAPLASARHRSRFVATANMVLAKARARDPSGLPDPFALSRLDE